MEFVFEREVHGRVNLAGLLPKDTQVAVPEPGRNGAKPIDYIVKSIFWVIVISMLFSIGNSIIGDRYVAQPLPANGTVLELSHVTGLMGPLSIVTANDQVGANYVIKVSDWKTSAPIMTVFVVGGQAIKVKVPLGTYRIAFIRGTTWYGKDDMFGKTAVSSVAEDAVSITQSQPGKVTGAEIVLGGPGTSNLPIRAN